MPLLFSLLLVAYAVVDRLAFVGRPRYCWSPDQQLLTANNNK
jgi:hypothetical protein